jgi:aspartate racemase
LRSDLHAKLCEDRLLRLTGGRLPERQPQPEGTHHLGILAHSVEGAALCLTAFGRRGGELLGEHQHPDVTLDCIAMGKAIPAWHAGDLATIRAILARSADRLAAAGAHFFACPDNTAHLALEHPGPDLALPGLHIAQIVAATAAESGYRRVGILGTKWTMEAALYPRVLAEHGLQAEIPGASDRTMVDTTIFGELVNGVFSDATRNQYIAVVERLRKAGCDAVALVCTEIPLLLSDEASPLPTLPSTTLLASAAAEVAVGRQPLPTWRCGQPR